MNIFKKTDVMIVKGSTPLLVLDEDFVSLSLTKSFSKQLFEKLQGKMIWYKKEDS